MEALRNFFTLNREIIYFVYGLAFFLLGFAIALQSRRSSRLELARALTWLAAFGIAHGLYEWGDLFIPVQAKYLHPSVIQLLTNLQLLLLGLSFFFLFHFGLTLLQVRGALYISISIFSAWVVLVFVFLPLVFTEPAVWLNSSKALARYFISSPGSLLAAYGLRQQTVRRIAPLQVPHIVNTLRVAGVGLVLYAVFGGFVVSPAPFFPANFVNAVTFTNTFGIPPLVFRSVIGFIIMLSIIRALEVFEVETDRLIESMEQQQILAAERERIARDLHDGAIQKVYTAGLLVEATQKLTTNPEAVERLHKALIMLNEAIGDLRRNLGELKTTPADLVVALQGVAADPRVSSLINVNLDLQISSTESFSPFRTTHLVALVSEAFANVARHARAQNVWLRAQRHHGQLQVTIQDDGLGIDPQAPAGYGLRNMRDRARLLNGQLNIENTGKGTTVTLIIPWKDEH